MGCIKNDETRNDEKKIDATATIRQGEGDGAVGNLEAIRCDARGMKGDDRNSREKPENLDMDKHQVSLARGELRSNRNPGIAAKPRGAVASEFPWCVGDLRGPSYLLNGHFWRKAAAAKRPTSERVINGLSTWLEPDISHLLIHRNNAPMALLFNTDRAKRFRLRISSDLMPCQSAQMLRGR